MNQSIFRILFLLFLLTSNFKVKGQTEHIRINNDYGVDKVITKDVRFIEYRNDVKKVIIANKIVYYGLDLSNMVLTHAEKVGQDVELKKYFPAWIDFFHKKITYEKDITNMLKKGKKEFTLQTSLNSVQSLYIEDSNKWISFEKFSLSIINVVKIVESYKLDESEGIGFVIIAENFNKNKPVRTSFYYTFFDIKTREILWSTYVKMAPNGPGMTEYWAGGIIDTFIDYEKEIYSKQRKNAEK